MKWYFALLLTSFFISSSAQKYIEEFDKYNATYTYQWRGHEPTNANEFKSKFVEYAEKQSLLMDEKSIIKSLDEKLRFYLYVVDLNNDGIYDIVYNGPSGGEPDVAHFYISQNQEFKKVFSSMQSIVKVDWKGDELDKIYVHDWGCCADPILVNKVYSVSKSGTELSFNQIWESAELRAYITKPKEYFSNPIKFEITNENYKLRYSPIIDDTTQDDFFEMKGNTMGILHKGFEGTAYASKTDETGRIWWYVLINTKYDISESIIGYESDKDYTHVVGWVSSRFVSKLK